MSFIRVKEEEQDEEMEIPTEEDGTIFLSSVAAQYPGTCGLKYKNPDTNSMRAVRCVENVLFPPYSNSEWKDHTYLPVFPKDNKRKMEDEEGQIRSKRPAQKCSDLIILGLPWKVEEQDLEEYFGQYGELVMTLVKRDEQGKSRGYGFIRYSNYESQEKVLGKRHVIEGRSCEVKIPHSKEESEHQLAPSRRIFVGRISAKLTKDDLKTYFEQFGDVDDVYISIPFRAFAFVTFRDGNVARKLIGEDHVIQGVSVYTNVADRKGTRESRGEGGSQHARGSNNRYFTQGGGDQYMGYSGHGGHHSDHAHHHRGGGSQHSNAPGNHYRPAPSQMDSTGYNPQMNNMMNPALLAAALGSWNSMLNGMMGADPNMMGKNLQQGGSGGAHNNGHNGQQMSENNWNKDVKPNAGNWN